MKKLFVLFALATLIPTIGFTQMGWKGVRGNGKVITKARSVSSFDKLSVSSGLNVYFTQGDDIEVTVEADENLQSLIETKVKNNELIVRVKATKSIRKAKMKNIYVVAPSLQAISSSSGSDFYSKSPLKGNDLMINVSSAGFVEAELNYNRLKCSSSSASNVKLKGTVNMAELVSSSGADIKAENLTVTKCKAKASSGSDIEVRVIESIDGKASSGGDITYFGNPKNVDKSESSGGYVSQN